MKGFIIAGTTSNVGKTTITLTLLGLLKKQSYNIAPFKVGPDYIDPKFHQFITGNPSCNLDGFMLDEDTVKYLFNKNTSGRDIAVIEGVMGLYDGVGTTGKASTADMARILNLPVILVVDAKGTSRSIAAMIKGYIDFNKKIKIIGVILNRVSGESHFNLLKQVIEKEIIIKCFGYLQNDDELFLKSRHLGLIPVEELKDLKIKMAKLTKKASKTIDIDKLNKSLPCIKPLRYKKKNCYTDLSVKGLRIGIAIDKAFNFYYKDNLDLMRESGIKLIDFSPLADKTLPGNIDALYIGGGFPEVFAKELSKNKTMFNDINKRLNYGLPCYAECGGLMYLTEGITINNKFYKLASFFKARCTMTKKLQRFGYVKIKYKNMEIRAHEFHHSILENIDKNDFVYRYTVTKASNGTAWDCGLSKGNVLAGYPHVHFYSNIDFYKEIIRLFKGDIV